MATGTRPGELSWQWPHAEFGRDSQSSFPQNADLDPKIEECSSNLTLPHLSQTSCATKLAHEKPSKGLSKFVRALRMLGRRVLFGLARGNFERYLLITYYWHEQFDLRLTSVKTWLRPGKYTKIVCGGLNIDFYNVFEATSIKFDRSRVWRANN